MGIKELKQNYYIDENVVILGSGKFGKVFKTKHIHQDNFTVAIKCLNIK